MQLPLDVYLLFYYLPYIALNWSFFSCSSTSSILTCFNAGPDFSVQTLLFINLLKAVFSSFTLIGYHLWIIGSSIWNLVMNSSNSGLYLWWIQFQHLPQTVKLSWTCHSCWCFCHFFFFWHVFKQQLLNCILDCDKALECWNKWQPLTLNMM